MLVPPFHENFGKRLIKSPKVYFVDSGLVCHLLGIESERMLRRSTFHGSIFEGFVASEIAKLQAGAGRRRELYYFRDQQGLEVDLLVPLGAGRLALIEAKASATVRPEMGGPLNRLARAVSRYDAQRFVIYRRPESAEPSTALLPGVSALGVDDLPSLIRPGGRGPRVVGTTPLARVRKK